MMHNESMVIQTQLLERLATPHEAVTLRKLREKDPQVPKFTGMPEHFLAWTTECQVHNFQDAVAIWYTKMAMCETSRRLFDTIREFAT